MKLKRLVVFVANFATNYLTGSCKTFTMHLYILTYYTAWKCVVILAYG